MMSHPTPHISVVIPVYKAELCLGELYRRLKTSLESISPDFEIVLVKTVAATTRAGDRAAGRSRPARARHPVQPQFRPALRHHCGLEHCHGEWVVVMDCDLQDRPEEIPRLYAKAQQGYDIVLARRGARRDPLLKRFASWLFYKLFSYLADIDYDGQTGNFRIMSRKVVTNFLRMHEQLRFFGGWCNGWVPNRQHRGGTRRALRG